MNQVSAPSSIEAWEVQLPEAPKPLASYIPCVRSGSLLFTSGTLPMKQGELIHKGPVGPGSLSLENAQQAARQCLLNALSVVKAELGSLKSVKRVVKITGFVMSTGDFYEQAKVMNGDSGLCGN